MNIPVYQVDAFADSVFRGNPAAVCPLQDWLPDETLQNIAAENNLSETAFFVRNGGRYHLRWFTPAVEIDLCGHATLASALILMDVLGEVADQVRFDTKSGELRVVKRNGLLALDFPSRPPAAVEPCAGLVGALGLEPIATFAARDYLVVYESEDQVRKLNPDMDGLKKIDRFAVIATAPGKDCDFVSRFFAPAKGVPEDPVTGSAHCTLIPYWAEKLQKNKLHARQISQRGGELFCELRGERVEMAGRGALYMVGEIRL